MSPRSPNLNQVIEHTLAAVLRNTHTSMPGEILKYDKAKQVVDVRPLLPLAVELEDGTIRYDEIAVLSNVRVGFPGGGGFRLAFPLKKGDEVAIFFAEASIDLWQKSGGVQRPPSSRRRFHLSDAFVLPALKVWQGASSSAATLGSDTGPQIVMRDDSIEFGARDDSPATEAMVLGSTYLGNEGTMLDQVSSALGSIATKLTIAGSSLSIAAGLNAVPMVGGAMALAGFTLVVTQLVGITTDVGQLITAISTFRAQDAQHKSTTLKVK